MVHKQKSALNASFLQRKLSQNGFKLCALYKKRHPSGVICGRVSGRRLNVHFKKLISTHFSEQPSSLPVIKDTSAQSSLIVSKFTLFLFLSQCADFIYFPINYSNFRVFLNKVCNFSLSFST